MPVRAVIVKVLLQLACLLSVRGLPTAPGWGWAIDKSLIRALYLQQTALLLDLWSSEGTLGSNHWTMGRTGSLGILYGW